MGPLMQSSPACQSKPSKYTARARTNKNNNNNNERCVKALSGSKRSVRMSAQQMLQQRPQNAASSHGFNTFFFHAYICYYQFIFGYEGHRLILCNFPRFSLCMCRQCRRLLGKGGHKSSRLTSLITCLLACSLCQSLSFPSCSERSFHSGQAGKPCWTSLQWWTRTSESDS